METERTGCNNGNGRGKGSAKSKAKRQGPGTNGTEITPFVFNFVARDAASRALLAPSLLLSLPPSLP
eukprot:56389-Rhodomonas_salina.1